MARPIGVVDLGSMYRHIYIYSPMECLGYMDGQGNGEETLEFWGRPTNQPQRSWPKLVLFRCDWNVVGCARGVPFGPYRT